MQNASKSCTFKKGRKKKTYYILLNIISANLDLLYLIRLPVCGRKTFSFKEMIAEACYKNLKLKKYFPLMIAVLTTIRR